MKRGPGRPRKYPPKLEEIFKTAFEIIDLKIDLAITDLYLKLINHSAWDAERTFKKILGAQKQDLVTLLLDHVKKYHPICDPKELDQTLRALREYWEQQRRSNDER